MRKIVLALFVLLAAFGAVHTHAAAGQDVFDFGDMPPLPPPLVDDAPAPRQDDTPPPPPLALPGTPSMSPLAPPPLAPPPGGLPAAPSAPAVAQPSTTSPLAPPPLAPPPLSPSSAGPDVTPVDLPGQVGAPPGAPVQAAAPVEETPRPGKISGGRVNVRAGPNTQYESIDVLTTGAPVVVLAKNGDWFKIVFPADKLASIHKNYVNADISGEIPEEGVPGIVNQDGSDVHAFYWDKSTVVGKLNKGDPVVIKQERGQWYRIAAPETARAYVFAEYVRVDGNQQVAVDSAPPPENPAVDLAAGKQDATGRLKLSDNDRRANEIKEAYFRRLQEQHQREQEQAVVAVNRLDEALNDLEARIRSIDAEVSAQYTYSGAATTTVGAANWAPPDPLYGGFTGWVENIGRVGGAPAGFRLTKGGEIRYFLRSDRFDLASYVGQRVWVNGNVELAAGAAANVLNVDQIRLLTEGEIAEGVRQQAFTLPGRSADAVTTFEPYEVQQTTTTTTTTTYGEPYIDPYAVPASDPYASLYSTQTTVTTTTTDPYAQSYIAPAPGVIVQPAPGAYPTGSAGVTDASQLPDVVGAGRSFYPATPVTGSAGEVDTDYFESPIISEIGP